MAETQTASERHNERGGSRKRAPVERAVFTVHDAVAPYFRANALGEPLGRSLVQPRSPQPGLELAEALQFAAARRACRQVPLDRLVRDRVELAVDIAMYQRVQFF